MKLYAPLFVWAVFLFTFNESGTLWNGQGAECFWLGGEQYLRLPNDQYGKIRMDDNGRRSVRLPDGSFRREKDHDAKAGAFWTVAKTTRCRIESPSEPKLSKRAEKAGEGSERYQAEGKIKSQCMSVNASYDRHHNEVRGVEYDFTRPGEARRRYGSPVQMYAVR